MSDDPDLYIYCSSEGTAFALSHAIYSMGMPLCICGHAAKTVYYTDPVQHPDHEDWWRLRMLGTGFFIHPKCNVKELDPFMLPYIQQGLMSQADLDAFHAAVIAGKGGPIIATEVLPAIFISTALTFDQMVADGWFPQYE